MKHKWSFLIILALFWNLSACSQESGRPVNTAYPGPVTRTIVSNTPTLTKAVFPSSTPHPISTISPTRTVFLPTRWRDFTPTPNSTPGVWPEFSSSVTYFNFFDGTEAGPLHFSLRYPPDWYLYPGYTVVSPGLEWQGTYIQNYERSGDPDQPSLTPGKVQLYTGMGPCLRNLGRECPLDSPLLSPGLPGVKNISEHDHFTFWAVELYKGEFFFEIYAAMPGTREENTELLQILDEILATVKLW
jgi:hypothetical protein